MRQNFGKPLIEGFFRRVDLTHLIDTSGAYIPGHGTPTVIIVGCNRVAMNADPVRAVQKIQGEPDQPADPACGVVWSAIVEQVGSPGSESQWISVDDVERSQFASHPWSLSGGGAGDLAERLARGRVTLVDRIEKPIGRAIRAGLDDAFLRPLGMKLRTRADRRAIRPLMSGEVVRDWVASPVGGIWYPYDSVLDGKSLEEELWPYRTPLSARSTFQGDMESAGLDWWEYQQHTASAYVTPLSITFPYVSTYSHFVLDRGGSVFKQTAPVMKLPPGASEEDYLSLLGVLNSSAAAFWLKQVCFDRGNGGIGGGISDEMWEHWFAFNGKQIGQLPLPNSLPLSIARIIDELAQDLTRWEPSVVCGTGVPVRDRLDEASDEHTRKREWMIALQEELDWQIYGLYDLLTEGERARVVDPSPSPTTTPEVRLGERAFEIVLARKMDTGEVETAWFERHGSTPITVIPKRWPDWYRDMVQARIDIIESRKDIALIERPECKRRWATEWWEKKEKAALRTWLLDRVEEPSLWSGLRDGVKQPRTLTVSQLADALRDDVDFNSVAQLYAADHMGKPDLPLADVLAEIVADEHVPYLAAMRYKDSGLRNREQWEQVWKLQREEDRTGKRLDIPVPPKYKGADFQKQSYWSHRGKLDVPKERFISYLGASPDADSTVLLGWAGWDHKDQAQALFNLIDDRTKQGGWGTDRVKPLLAGLLEIMPWVRQWHGEYDEEWEGVPADEYQAYFEELCAKQQVSEADMRAWRPEKKTRGKKKPAPKKAAAEQATLDAEE